MLMHDKVNRMSDLSERTRTETLRYMGLDKDQRLVLIGSRHHFVPEAGTKERPYHARILAKLNRWARQYPEAAARIYSVSLEDENQAFTSLNWTIRQPEILRDLQSETDCPCIRPPRDGGGMQIRLFYSGSYYRARADTDYRADGLQEMNVPLKLNSYHTSKTRAAAKAAAVLATPFTAAPDIITLPVQIPATIRQMRKSSYR